MSNMVSKMGNIANFFERICESWKNSAKKIAKLYYFAILLRYFHAYLGLEADFCGGGSGTADVDLAVLRVGYFHALEVVVVDVGGINVHGDIVGAALGDGDYRRAVVVPNRIFDTYFWAA